MYFVASLLGALVVQRAIRKHGRASIIVFSVSIVMFASIVLMTIFGAMKFWADYQSMEHMLLEKFLFDTIYGLDVVT